jgi:DNA-binding transcriptional MerR regulator
MSKLTQIPLDFGPEDQSQPPAGQGGNGSGDEAARQYIAADGVGVRIRYKRPATSPAEGGLFEEAVPGPADVPSPMPEDRQTDEAPTIETPRAQPEDTATTPISAPATTPISNEDIPSADEGPDHPAVQRVAPSKTSRSATGPSRRGRKSLKQVGAEADLIEIPEDEVLFSKQYYTMGEVAEMFRVNQSLLRFWETEFDILQPKKNKKGDRYFRPVDIKSLHLIYHLLRQKKYTIEGAKEFLKKNKKAEERFHVIQRLQEIRAFLLEWKAQL